VGDTLLFSKIAGPSWLHIAADGVLSGIPGNDDVGQNQFTIRVEDNDCGFHETTMVITVINLYDGKMGLADFAPFAMHWLESDCGICDGADLTFEGNVNMDDLIEFADHWLEGVQCKF
ncbi:MAG: hypothetical protein KAT56_01405, partial [Sedimentisphaerales bacterium]|nr:hypothetical protein [Sedimentisphaerales bacterium]